MSTSNTGQQLVRDARTGQFGPGNRSGGRPPGSRDKHSKLRDMMTDHALATDPDTGQTRVQAALDEMFANDKEAYLRFTLKLLPRPSTAPPETDQQPQLMRVQHVVRLLDGMDAAKQSPNTPRPPLPCGDDGGDGVESVFPGEWGCDADGKVIPGGCTGDFMVDVLGVEGAAKERARLAAAAGDDPPDSGGIE